MSKKKRHDTSLFSDSEKLADFAIKSNYSPASLARLIDMPLRTLQRHFEIRLKSTPMVWMRDLRLNIAKDLLKKGEKITLVSKEVGYKQISHFSRSFKKEFGVCPQNFQKRSLAEATPDLPLNVSEVDIAPSNTTIMPSDEVRASA